MIISNTHLARGLKFADIFKIKKQIQISKNSALSYTFGDIKSRSQHNDWHTFAASHAILAPRNDAVNELHNACMDQLPGEDIVLSSIDSTINEDDVTYYTTEYINSLNTSRVPPHKLILKKDIY